MSNVAVSEWRDFKNAPTEPATIVVQMAIDATEEAINDRLGRVIAVAGASSARTFAPVSNRSSLLEIDDCTAVTLVTENGSTIDPTGYQLEPIAGRNQAGMTVPYSRIRLFGTYWTPTYPGQASVSVTATWGWASLPARYKEAVLLTTSDLLDAKDVRNGVIGFSDFAAFRIRENTQVAKMLEKMTRLTRTSVPV